MIDPPQNEMRAVTKTSRYSYAQTVASLQKTIKDAGNTIFAVIDQAAAAAEVGMSLRPTTLILFGNPKGGTPLMEAFPLVALELPLKVLIWAENGAVSVSYVPPAEIANRYGVTGMETRIEAMDRAFESLTSGVT
jgi:uncharacterized protein (DUF302 family)